MMRQLIGSILFATLVSTVVEAQTTRKVPQDFPTIQAAIVAAQNGDMVRVAPGTYLENINFLGKAITVVSEAGPNFTTIDGGLVTSVVTFSSGEGLSSILDGFTIRNGRGSPNDGGGIRIVGSPTVRHNRIVNNTGCTGLGIAINTGSPLIQDNVISDNTASGCSGGTGGGGILILAAGSAQILDNIISNNSTNGSSQGGGISLFAAGTPLIRGNIITGNSAVQGGGIAMVNFSIAQITQNVIAGNTAPNGGGIYWLVPSTSQGTALTNNTIVDNNSVQQGSAIYTTGFNGATPVQNNVIIAKSGQAAIYCSSVSGTNLPIFAFNNVFADQAAAYAGTCLSATGTNGNISTAPVFVDRTAGNFRLVSGSPGINAGDNTVPNLPALDLDSFPRILPSAGTVDLGAYEFAGATTATTSTTSLTFADQAAGTQSVSSDITVTNTGSTNLMVSNVTISGEFLQTNTCQTPTGIPAGQSCTISVQFAPTAGGPRSGQLTIAGNLGSSLVSLSGTGLAALTLSTTALTFSDQRIGTASSATALILSNNGAVALNLSSITTTGNFTGSNDCTPTLAAGSSCTINIQFAPTARGIQYGTVSINVSGSLYIVTLSGRGVTPLITFSSPVLGFGNQALGSTSTTQNVTISNPGDIALAISSIGITGDFGGSNNCGGSLGVGGTCTVNVAFSPTTPGFAIGAITVSDDAAGSPHVVSLSGSGTGSLLTPSPASLLFGNQAVNTTSASRLITLRNTGNVQMTIFSIVTSADFSRTTTCSTVSPNAICTVFVSFTPTTVGPEGGTLTITDSAFGSPHVVALSGTGVDVAFSPTPLAFGDVHIGTVSTRTATVTNNGPNTLNIASLSISAGFSQTSTCGSSLNSGATCSIDVTFSPVTAGLVVSGTLTMTDSAIGSPHTVSLSGRGVAGNVSLAPATMNFGSDLVGTTSPLQTVTMTNTGTGPLSISSITTSGDFAQSNTCATTLPTNGSCSIGVTFSPTAPGNRTGSLTISSDGSGSPNSAILSGTGLTSLAIPAITGISPDNISVGASGLTLTVNGSGFSSLSVVRWGGSDRPTTFVNNATLTAAISTNDFAAMGTIPVSVFNPSPGGGLSNNAGFVVYRPITLTTKDLIYDRIGGKIYASVPGTAPSRANTITPIDPATGVLGTSPFMGSDPGKLAISGDSRYIYVSLDGAAQVRPFDTTSQTPGTAFALGTDSTFGPYYAEDIAVAPGNPGTIAVSRKNLSISPRHAGVAIYENGVKRPTETARHTGSNVIEFSSSQSILYGYNSETSEYGFRTMSVDSSGVVITNVQPNLISGSIDIQFEGGRIYTTTGRVIDPASRTLLGTFPVPVSSDLRTFVADSSIERVFYLVANSSSVQIQSFDVNTFASTGTISLPGQLSSANMGSLIRWGETGLAFRSGAQLVTLQIPESFLGTHVPTFSLSPNTGQQGQSNLNVAVTGQFTGFIAGQMTASFGPGITINSVTVADALHATANITIAPAATVGPRSVTISTGNLALTPPDAFTVTVAPGLLTTWGLGSSLSASPAGIFKAIATGESHSIALRADGTLVGWGDNSFGQSTPPAGTFTAIAVGAADSFAIRTDGTLIGWGYSPNGETNIPPGTYKAVAGGASHTIAIRTDGTLVGWGNNTFGQINVPAGTFKAIAAAGVFNIAIRTDGTLVGWGSNFNGLIDVPAGTFTAIAVGSQHSVALRTDGTLAAWGLNTYGQTNVPAGTFTAIAASERNSFAIRSDGTIISWGDSTIGSVPAGTFTAIAARTNRLVALGNHPNAPRDLNGDGKSDVLWRDTTGKVSLWQMNGFTVTSDTLIANIWPDWKIVGTGDFNADGKMDILWRDGTGTVAVWLMNGVTVSSYTIAGSIPVSWTIAGVVDFNADGKADILWRNITGDVAIWLMNGASIASNTTIANIFPGWTISGTGDFNGDGKADILWREDSGRVAIWLMNGTSVLSSTVIANISTGWTITGTGDFNGDGKADILWRESSGDVGIWLMNGTSVISTRVVANIWMGWSIAAVGDFNADGKADILWRDGSGNISMWFMDGTAVANWSGIGNVADRVVQ